MAILILFFPRDKISFYAGFIDNDGKSVVQVTNEIEKRVKLGTADPIFPVKTGCLPEKGLVFGNASIVCA